MNHHPTIESEALWLLDNLRWLYDNEPHWDDLERDVKAAQRRMEATLYAGEREERSTVPCIDCDLDRDGKPLRVLLVRSYGKTRDDDRWVCPRCARRYDHGAYVRAQYEDGARRGTDRHVPVATAADALKIHPARIRRLANACDISTRGLLVWWPWAREELDRTKESA